MTPIARTTQIHQTLREGLHLQLKPYPQDDNGWGATAGL